MVGPQSPSRNTRASQRYIPSYRGRPLPINLAQPAVLASGKKGKSVRKNARKRDADRSLASHYPACGTRKSKQAAAWLASRFNGTTASSPSQRGTVGSISPISRTAGQANNCPSSERPTDRYDTADNPP